MFGISFTELTLVSLVALLVVGPQRLPAMLRTLGGWVARARSLSNQVKEQIGIDDFLKEEGLNGGVDELRMILRGDMRGLATAAVSANRAKTASQDATPENDTAPFEDEPTEADWPDEPPAGPDSERRTEPCQPPEKLESAPAPCANIADFAEIPSGPFVDVTTPNALAAGGGS